MKQTILITTVLLTALLNPVQAGDGILKITSPEEGSEVGTSSEVSGTITDSKAIPEIWILVNTVGTRNYWAQCQASVSTDGTWWKGNDEPGGSIRFANEDSGSEFAIIAVADPEESLVRGQLYEGCPKARLVSDPVSVKKTKN